jgi:hypothetical protein
MVELRAREFQLKHERRSTTMSYEVDEMRGVECLFADEFEDAAAIAAHFHQPVEKVVPVCQMADDHPGVGQVLETWPGCHLIITAEEQAD